MSYTQPEPDTQPDLRNGYSVLEPHYQAENVQVHHDKHDASSVAGASATIERLEQAGAATHFAGLVGLEKTSKFDVWEHAYHPQYRSVRPDFAEALRNLVDWPDVAERFTGAQRASFD
ncbi:MAG: hypothetical protein M0Z82_09115 [Actinomycetota bacterium]|jgi:Fe-Mn family superoxide dismutase|nr:hypothetical protein [Actinomycetota bacterium]